MINEDKLRPTIVYILLLAGRKFLDKWRHDQKNNMTLPNITLFKKILITFARETLSRKVIEFARLN